MIENEHYLEKHFQESCELRDSFWKKLGEVDEDVMAPAINPAFMGGSRWPNLRQAWMVVRRQSSTIITSDGLSDPFDEPVNKLMKTSNGFGIELYMETSGNLDPVQGSWQFDMIYEVSQHAADTGNNIRDLLKKYKYMSTELWDVGVPKEFKNSHGRVGVLLGLPSETVPPKVKLSLQTILIVNVKLLTLRELEYVVENKAKGREQLVELMLLEANPSYSDLDRKSVI